MPQVTRKVWKCGFEDCGHEWYKYKDKEPPSRCSACKRWNWNVDRKKESLPEVVPPPVPMAPFRPILIVSAPKLLSNCPICSEPLADFGTSKRCLKCERNF